MAEMSPQEKAAKTDKWTEILFRALSARVSKRWRFVSFRGAGGGEWRGIVDILAVRKDTSQTNHELMKSGDLFEFVLVQMKGGSAKGPSLADIQRLKAVQVHYHDAKVVLFSWNRKIKGKATTSFQILGEDDAWQESSALEIFGR